MARPIAISFDCAETLISTNWNATDMALECAKSVGLNLDPGPARSVYSRLLQARWKEYTEVNASQGTDGSRAWWRELTIDWLNQLGESTHHVDSLLLEADERLFGDSQQVFKLYDDTFSVLTELRDAGHRMLVISNWDYSLPWVLEQLRLTDFFCVVVPSLTIGIEKPDPRIFEYALKKAEVNSNEVVHVGDSLIDDVQGARNAGIRAIHLDRTASDARPGMIRTLSDLPTYLKQFDEA